MKINHIKIKLQNYHGEIVGRIVYGSDESALYSLPELNNIIALWRMGKLCGSFAIGHTLAEDAIVELVQK